MKNSKKSLLPSLSVRKPITVLMCFAATLLVGIIAYSQIAVELMPTGFTAPFLGVWVPYQNSNPQEVEEKIAKPIEDIVQTISGIKTVSTNSSEGGCWIGIRFNQGTEMETAYSTLRDRMERVKKDLPEDLDRYYLRKFSSDDDPILYISIALTDKLDDPYTTIDNQIVKQLQRLDGVANIEIWGTDQKEIMIQVDQEKVKAHRIGMYDLINGLRKDNFSLSSGYVLDGRKKILLRSVAKYRSMEDIKNLKVNDYVRVSDIADVVYDIPERKFVQRVDRKPAVKLGIFKESAANTAEVCQALVANLERIKKVPVLAGSRMDILFNQGEYIEDSLNNIQQSAAWGGIFALLVLYFFLRRTRMTIIITLAIPVSVLMTLTVLYFMGWTLNLMTMMGIMISIGLVVDCSVVVVENITRLKNKGLSAEDSAVYGASEVGLAITLATLTTVVVFLPLLLMNDSAGMKFYLLRIGMPVILALVFSLFVALYFIPLASSRLTSDRKPRESWFIGLCIRLYEKGMVWTLNHRVDAMIILILIVLTSFMIDLKETDESRGHINNFNLLFDLPSDYTLEECDKFFQEVEDIIYAHKDEYDVKVVDTRFSTTWARVEVFLNPPEHVQWWQALAHGTAKLVGIDVKDPMSREDVRADILKKLPKYPGISVRTHWSRGSGQEGSIQLVLYGEDTNTLVALSKDVEKRLKNIPEVLSVDNGVDQGSDEARIYINRELAKKYEINPQTITGTIAYAVRGFELPEYRTDENEIKVRIQLKENDRENLYQVKNLTFFTPQGKEIPLNALATFTVEKGVGEIYRENAKTVLNLKIYTNETDDIPAFYEKIDSVMVGFKMPRGYSWDKGERFIRVQEQNESQKFAGLLAITFVLLLMGILFESTILPFSVILASIPFALVGARWMLFITDSSLDLMAGIGIIILIGIVVNNAIVLIDRVIRLRSEGWSREEAIVEAGKNRFRPIMMTAFTTVFGLLPMALGNASLIGIPYAPMGRAMIGGLLASTFLTLLALPLIYTYFDDLRSMWKRVTASALTKTTPGDPQPSGTGD